MKYEVARRIAWRPSPKGTERVAAVGDVLDDAKLKGADVDWLIDRGALIPRPGKGVADGSR